MKSRLFTALAAGATALTYAAYRTELKAAKRRIEDGSKFIDSIEFAESGDGPPALVIHGAGGGFDQGLALGRAFLGHDYRIIAPSRFGYLGTPLPADASPEAQADAYLRLLDALEIERVPVIGVSAGGPSTLQFCLRHPERCSALVLVVAMTFIPNRQPVRELPPFLSAVMESDFLFWTATKIAHAMMVKTILSTPIEVYRCAAAEERRAVDGMLRGILPISRRAAGLRNEATVAATLSRYALETIDVPTLVISAADDGYGTYESSIYTAEQIPNAKLVTFATGGHLLVGHEEEVRSLISNLFAEATQPTRDRHRAEALAVAR